MATQKRTQFRTTSNLLYGTSSTESGLYPFVWTSDPEKVKGVKLKFPSGNYFLKATDYSRSRWTQIPGSAESSEYSRFGGYRRWKFVSGPGGYQDGDFTSGNWRYQLADYGLPSLIAPPDFVTGEYNEAVTKCLNEISDSKLNLGENLFTLSQTVKLFSSPLQNLVTNLTKMYRDPKMRPHLSKSYSELYRNFDRKVASKYLEYVYGLKPLMEDFYNLASLAKKQGSDPFLLHAVKRARRKYEPSDYQLYSPSLDQELLRSDTKVRSMTSCHIWAKLSDTYPGTRSLNQLGLINPMSLIWELVPYSFVVDWVLPVGPVLQALTAPAGLDFVDGSVSRRAQVVYTASSWQSDRYTDWTRVYSRGTSQFSYEGYRRERLSSWPRPGLWFDSDPLRLHNDGSDRVFKALAVAIMSLRRS